MGMKCLKTDKTSRVKEMGEDNTVCKQNVQEIDNSLIPQQHKFVFLETDSKA